MKKGQMLPVGTGLSWEHSRAKRVNRAPLGKCQDVAQGEADGKRGGKTIHCGRKGGDSPSGGAE